MKTYLLLFMSFTLLLFATPKNSSMRCFTKQAKLKTECAYNKRPDSKQCTKKCLKHQTHSDQQNNKSGVVTDCGQQAYAIVASLHTEPVISFRTSHDFILPHILKHRSPVIEYDPEPPQLS